MAKIIVEGTEITVIKSNNEDYISLTDMIKAKDGDFFVTDWLRNRNTLEYIGIWEKFYNPAFNYGEFAIIKSQAGENINAVLINDGVSQGERLVKLNKIAIQQMRLLTDDEGRRLLK